MSDFTPSKFFNFRNKIFVLVLVILGFFIVSTISVVQRQIPTFLEDGVRQNGAAIARILSKQSVNLILTEDLVALYDLVDQVMQVHTDDIVYILIQNEDALPLLPTPVNEDASLLAAVPDAFHESTVITRQMPTRTFGLVLEVAVPIYAADEMLGVVRVGLSYGYVTKVVDMFMRYFVTNLLWAVAVGFLLVLFFCRRLLRPVAALTEGARRIGQGDLDNSIPILSHDEIGSLAREFNRMASRLRKADEEKERVLVTVSRESRLREGELLLGAALQGGMSLNELSSSVLKALCQWLDVPVAALYSVDGEQLHLAGSHGMKKTRKKTLLSFGEGVSGQAAVQKTLFLVEDIPSESLTISGTCCEVAPRTLCAMPLLCDTKVVGVVELGFLKTFAENDRLYLDRVGPQIATALQVAKGKDRINELLGQTQKLAERLQSQQEELRVSNEELEEQTQALRMNEEELRSQQEELQVTNEELEEKSESLQRQNLNIKEKNRELELAWAEIEAKAKALEEAYRYKSEFLANMSHELRTPLNSLLLLARDLTRNKGGNLTEQQVEAAKIIYSSGQDLLNLINDILDLSKIEAGRVELERENVFLHGLADWLKKNFTHMAEDKGLAFSVVVEEGVPEQVQTDRSRLEQILRNLVSNAIKFTQTGEVAVRFLSILEKEGTEGFRDGLAIRVRDTGVGIAKEKQELIFEAFQQADGSTARQYGGTGLGLSISRKLTEILGGRLTVTSVTGEGSTFSLLLPETTQEKAEQSAPVSHAPHTPPNVSFSAEPPAMLIADDRHTISPDDKVLLIVEDDPNFAQILMGLGREKGFKCLATGSGIEALQLAEQYQVRGIILDIHLLDIDGWQVLDSLKKNASLRHIPVHVMSGDEKDIDACARGAVGFLTKPVSEEDILSAFTKLEKACSQRIRDILVVENDISKAQEIAALVGTKDVNIISVDTGEKALAEVRKRDVDCMILDIALSDMSCFDLLEKMETDAEDALPPPVIIYAGRQLSREESERLRPYTETIIIKGVKSAERLLDEVSLFLHRVIDTMPHEKRKMIASLYEQDIMFQEKTVLIVDDDMRNAFALSKVLEERGMEVVIAHDGASALTQLEQLPAVDIVLMDIMMPGMDGYETMKRIRAQEALWSLPIIALTAKAMPEDKSLCMAAGASDYLTKPVDETRLLSMMRVWLYR